MKPVLVILAAGASTRLGTCKALVELGRDRSGAARAPLDLLLDAGAELDLPLVVAGAHVEAIRAALASRAPRTDRIVECAHNAAWNGGRLGGVAVAARARPGRDLVLAPVDVPLVSRAVFAALARAWTEHGSPERGWLAPAVRDASGVVRHGHPIVIGRGLAREIELLPKDLPLRALRERAKPLLAVGVEDPSVLDDLDTPADLARLRSKFAP